MPDTETNDSGETSVPPPVPKSKLEDESEDLESDQDEDTPKRNGSAVKDPYSNLDGAFGNYLADEPRPMGANNAGRNDEDDLLF